MHIDKKNQSAPVMGEQRLGLGGAMLQHPPTRGPLVL